MSHERALLREVRLETPRLVLRTFTASDLGSLLPLLAAGDHHALPPGAPRHGPDLAIWLDSTVHRLQRTASGVNLAVRDRATGDHLGAVSLFGVDWRLRAAEIGFGIRSDRRRSGYAAEALPAATAWALGPADLQRVELRADPANTAALRVAEKSGYLYEGTLRRAGLGLDGFHDLAVYGSLLQA
jgi:RimJ/RimL family protein N-acetyltransferase